VSQCKRIIDTEDQALSIVYASDGANQRNCNLDLFTNARCKGNAYVRKSLTEDISDCENVQATYARVSCTAQVRIHLSTPSFDKLGIQL
jgi:hypothetical protein